MDQTITIAAWTHQWRKPMLRFAQLHLYAPEDAEDVVQDALMAMLGVDQNLVRQGDVKSYVFGILRHKITDRLRKKYRSESAYQDVFNDDIDNVLFDAASHWLGGAAPCAWKTPEEELHTGQFFAIVDICINKLPAKPARVFSMKAFLGCESAEICHILGLSKSDYWQCMSRARKQIQLCLNQNWFEGAAT